MDEGGEVTTQYKNQYFHAMQELFRLRVLLQCRKDTMSKFSIWVVGIGLAEERWVQYIAILLG